MNRKSLEELVRPPFPPVIRIEPAGACNLRCNHCPTGVVKMSRGLMSPATFDRVVAELTANVPPIRAAVLYHGGEPLLNKHLPQMARRVKDAGVEFVKTVTNGMLIGEENAELLVKCGLDAIEVSMDAETPEENDRVRRRAKSSRVLDGVRLLINAREKNKSPVKLIVATTQFADSGHSIDEPAPVPDWLRSQIDVVDGAVEYKSTWAMQWPSGQPSRGYDLLHDDRPLSEQPSCSLLQDTISIRWDGTVVACCYDLTSLSNLGNVNDEALADIWAGEQFVSFRRRFYSRRFPALCRGCGVVTGAKYLLRKNSAEPREQATIRLSDVRKST